MQSEHPAIHDLASSVIAAARAIAEPLQREIIATSDKDLKVQWIAIAAECMSFYIVLATKMALQHGLPKTQTVVNALGRVVSTEVIGGLFGPNAPEVQLDLVDAFLAEHYRAETDYGRCTTVFPSGPKPDENSLVGRFADRLLASSGRGRTRESILALVVATTRGHVGANLFSRVQRACKEVPTDADH